jgi:hypothetical protein
MSKCECEFRIRMLGDGCRYCQPQTYIDTMERCNAENVAEDEALLRQALEAAEQAAAELESPYTSETAIERALHVSITALRERLGEKV